MTPTQWEWLKSVSAQIPSLFATIQSGCNESRYVMGERVIKGRRVRLSLLAQVVDPGPDPLHSHASDSFPGTHDARRPPGMVVPEYKPRKRTRRW